MASRKDPIELFRIAKAGGEAATVSKVMGAVLEDERELLLSQFGNPKKSPEELAHLSGQIWVVQKILSRLRLLKEEGADAADSLRR